MKTRAELYPGTDTNCPGLVFSTPSSYEAVFNANNKAKVDLFISQIDTEITNVAEIFWWSYRVPPYSCIACDIYGAEASSVLNMSITISGETVIPSYPQEEPFEFQDETDAWCFLTLLIERFQLNHVKAVSGGLGLQFSGRAIEK